MTSHEAFAAAFDAIEIDPARAPSLAAIEAAFAACARPDEPGFYLLDDAHGRFAVDRLTGVITLADETLIESERDTVHAARLKVIETSGDAYELTLRLKLTGIVPQMVGGGGEAQTLDDEDEAVAPAEPDARGDAPDLIFAPWPAYAALLGMRTAGALGDEASTPFGAISVCATPTIQLTGAELALETHPPRPSAAGAHWHV